MNLGLLWTVVVCCRPSSVVCCPSTFDVYTLKTTFVKQILWNLVRMFVLTISRPSLIMGHVESKSRSPDQILGYSCLHTRGYICDPILMKLHRNVFLTISIPKLNMGYVGLKTRSPWQILGNSCLHSRGHICDPILTKHGQNC